MDFIGKKLIAVIDTHCSQFVTSLKQVMEESGLWAYQSFDLRSTRAVHEGCSCPHHGTDQCNCELVVLLVYRAQGSPTSLILDGRDGKTFVYVANDTGRTVHRSTVELFERLVHQAMTQSGEQALAVEQGENRPPMDKI